MQLLTDALHRIAYSTDASAYREMPLGVAYPKDEDDLRDLLAEAKKRNTHLIMRAGGTSIAGQVVGSGIVVDVSRYMNRILEICPEEQWARVQPGVVRDELNIALKPYGLFFSPETSTSNRCCIGGMVGNNSCGTHSLVYGSTRHHVIGLKWMSTDGTLIECTNEEVKIIDGDSHPKWLQILEEWQQDTRKRQIIEEAFPDKSLRRRSCGYALDECLYNSNGKIDIPALLCGSEGTLGIVTEIKVSLDPLPPAHKMVLCEMLDDMDKAWEANLRALERKPVAVELIDGKILELAKDNLSARRSMDVLKLDLHHLPKAILVSEFCFTDASTTDILPIRVGQERDRILWDSDVQEVWNLRKAGLGVLTGMEGDAKPIGVIEDTAVAPERLGGYMQDFGEMMKELGLECVYYGHISTGELHLRPILDIKKAEDRKKFREVARRTAELVKKHKGSLSGEHGDGRLRGEFIPLMYGETVYGLFRELKRAFDPEGLLNMGKIVDTPPMDEYLRYDINQSYAVSSSGEGWEEDNLMQRIERCNGAGDCRKSNLIGGTMCPSYKSTGEEIKTTRARANVLREVLTRGDTDGKTLDSPWVEEVLDSCLACKGCKSECPSNVDMTRLRSEILQRKYDRRHTPWRIWLVARMAWVEKVGSWMPDIYNFFARNAWSAWLLKRMLRFATERQIPTLSRHSMRWLISRQVEQPAHPKGKVYLFADEFTNFQEAELGLCFAELLTYLGYEVQVPKHVESGRAAISKGCLHLASRYANQNVEYLHSIISSETPLVGIEPSCILSFRDEYPRLVDKKWKQDAIELGKNSLLFDEFLWREVQAGRIDSNVFHALYQEQTCEIYLHGHCHQKALVGVEKTAKLLRLIPQSEVKVIGSGCCGMAGSYGYEQSHYDSSMAIGEMVLFPAVRQAQEHSLAVVCAPGTSCRQQIKDGTGVKAWHPIEVLWQSIKN